MAGSRDELLDTGGLADDVAVLAGHEMTLSFLLSAVPNNILLTNCDDEMSN